MGAINPNLANVTREETYLTTFLSGAASKALEIGKQADEMVDAQKAANIDNIDDAATMIRKIDKNEGAKKNLPIPKKKEVEGEKLIVPTEEINKEAGKNFGKDPQFKSQAFREALEALPGKIRNCKSSQEIIDIVKREFGKYPPELQKKVFDFLEATTNEPLKSLVRAAKAGFAAAETGGAESSTPTGLAGTEEAEKVSSKLEALTDASGEPLNSVTVAEQYLKKFANVADIKKDLDLIQHDIGVKIKHTDAVEALLINLGKEGQVTQDTRALLNIATAIKTRIETQCNHKDIVPLNISTEEIVKCILTILAHPRISGEKVLSMAHNLVGAH